MRTIVIESPLSSPSPEGRARNIVYAKAAMRFVINLGHAPFASHLLYTQVLDDADPEQRDIGIRAGLALGGALDERWFFLDFGMSQGMHLGLDAADRYMQATRKINLGDDWRALLTDVTKGF